MEEESEIVRKARPIWNAIIRWEDEQSEGFHGILTNPRGEQGFLSKINNHATWTPIVEGQDPSEVMRAAKALHDAESTLGTVNRVNQERLNFLMQEVKKLTKPKQKPQA